jgi:drug/metabolite transporter (DMT)-like permease
VKIDEKSYAPHLTLLTVQIMFGSLPVVGKFVMQVIPAFSLVGFRVGITTIALVTFQIYRRDLWLKDKKDYKILALFGLIGVVLNMTLFIVGLSLTTASNSSLLAVTIPIFTLTIGSILGFEKLRTRKIFGIVLAAIGVVFLINPTTASFSNQTTIGDILVVLNSLSYGVYVAISKETIARNGAIKSITWMFIFASLVSVPIGLHSLYTVDISSVQPIVWLAIIHIAMFCTTMPYILNAWSLARVNPSTVAVYVYLQPVIGFVLAVLVLGEKVDFKLIIAAILIFVGVFFVTAKPKNKPNMT